jgi:anthranilate phosphoribosyltransferase
MLDWLHLMADPLASPLQVWHDSLSDGTMHLQTWYIDTLKKLQNRIDLEVDESEQVLQLIFEQKFSEIQIGALLVALAAKGESVNEIVGFVRAMRRFAVKLNHSQDRLVDTAGTGGDASGTFNISTGAAFVIAGAGIAVAKHGNRAMSGKCGSADVLSCLGVNIEAPAAVLEDCLSTCGITFLFAPAFHPAMKTVGRVRKELGIRTLFNVLGPLANPAGARRQIIGVFSPHLTETLGDALLRLDCEHALVFSGEDGLDEISLSARTRITEVQGGVARTTFVSPEDLGLGRSPRAAFLGGDVECNAQLLRRILSCQADGAQADIVLLNAAAGIYVAGRAGSLQQGLELARESLLTGKALEKLELLVKRSNPLSVTRER